MPGVEEEEGHHEPEDVGRDEGDDEGEEDLVLEELADGEDGVLVELVLDRLYGDEDGGEHEVSERGVSRWVDEREGDYLRHDADPENNHSHVEDTRTLRPITQSEHKTGQQRSSIEPLEDLGQNPAHIPQ